MKYLLPFLFIASACFGWDYQTNTESVVVNTDSIANWDAFSWTWNGNNDQYLKVNFNKPVTNGTLYLRLSRKLGVDPTLDIADFSITAATNAACAFSRTNVPPNNIYFAEFALVKTGTVSQIRTLSKGKVRVLYSLYQEDPATQTWSRAIGPHAWTESDPVWAGVSSLYSRVTLLVAATNALDVALRNLVAASTNNLHASAVTCTGTYTNVQDALDALFYVAPSITALTGGGTYIKGQTIADPAITWTVNKTMTTRGISGVATATLGAGGSGTYTDTGRNLTTTGTYTLTVGDGTGTDTENETFTFTNRRYVGASATTNQSNAEIIAMTASTQAKGASGTTGALSSEYIVIAYPASLGACTTFSLGGFSTTAWPSVTQTVTNAYGYAESYYVYRSQNAQTTGGITYDIQ